MADVETESRGVDQGASLHAFSDEFFVQCPQCRKQAKVARSWNRDHQHWRRAGLTCTNCEFSRRADEMLFCPLCPLPSASDWVGPARLSARRRCDQCGVWLFLERRLRAAPKEDWVELTCDGCAQTTRSSFNLYPASGEASDLCFGLPLWLQTDCRDETLWAFNARHLELLRGYLGATQREKGRGKTSPAARLPRWLKRAEPADALRAVSRLGQRLRESKS